MNPVMMGFIATLLRRRRTCPNCGRRQIVPWKKRNETVSCELCGSDIPPRK